MLIILFSLSLSLFSYLFSPFFCLFSLDVIPKFVFLLIYSLSSIVLLILFPRLFRSCRSLGPSWWSRRTSHALDRCPCVCSCVWYYIAVTSALAGGWWQTVRVWGVGASLSVVLYFVCHKYLQGCVCVVLHPVFSFLYPHATVFIWRKAVLDVTRSIFV